MLKYIGILAVFICQLSYAQKATKAFDNSSDSLPQFIFGKAEFDSILYWNKQIPKAALLIDGLTADIKLTFDIDTLGRIQNIVTDDYVLQLSKEFIENNSPGNLRFLNRSLIEEAKRLLLLSNELWRPARKDKQKVVKRIYTVIAFSAYKDRTASSDRFLDSLSNEVLYSRFNTGAVTENYRQKNLFGVGVRKMKEKKTRLAILYFLQAIEFNKNDINAYYNSGICYYRLNDNVNACKAWRAGKEKGDTGVDELLDKYCK